MRRIKESKAEAEVVAWADANKIPHTKMNIKGRRGWPDQIFYLPGGRPYLLEMKAEGETLRPLQAHVHKQLLSLGYWVEVHVSAAPAIAFMKAYVSLWNRFWAKVKKGGPDECWKWHAATSPQGYGVIGLGGSLPTETAHRVSWIFANGPITEVGDVMHKCNNKVCVNPKHLQFGTRSQNLQAAYDDGLRLNTPRGERRHNAKLTETQARLLLNAPHGSSSALCRKFGVLPSVGASIRAGRTWKHLRKTK